MGIRISLSKWLEEFGANTVKTELVRTWENSYGETCKLYKFTESDGTEHEMILD